MARAIAENKTHYLQTTGVPRLRELFAEKLRDKNGIPIDDAERSARHQRRHSRPVPVCHALLEPGDEVIVPDPEWPPTVGNVLAARRRAGAVSAARGARLALDLDELEPAITPKTRVALLNSPNNPTGGVLTRDDIERLAAIARERDLWVISDEAYEDVVFEASTSASRRCRGCTSAPSRSTRSASRTR